MAIVTIDSVTSLQPVYMLANRALTVLVSLELMNTKYSRDTDVLRDQ